jgi:hypothetical protein
MRIRISVKDAPLVLRLRLYWAALRFTVHYLRATPARREVMLATLERHPGLTVRREVRRG